MFSSSTMSGLVHPLLWRICASSLRVVAGILVAGLAIVLLVLVWFRLWGLPAPLQTRIIHELAIRRIFIEFSKLCIDASGDVVIRDVVLLNPSRPDDKICRVDRVAVGIRWFEWWRGEAFLHGVTLHGGRLDIPLGEETLTINDLRGGGHLENGRLVLEGVRGRILKVQIEMEGIFGADLLPPKSESSKPSDPAQSAAAWKKVRQIFQEIAIDEPGVMQATLTGQLRQDGTSKCLLQASLPPSEWRGCQIEGLTLMGFAEEGRFRLDRLELLHSKGLLRLDAEAHLAERTGWVRMESTLPPSAFAPLLPQPWKTSLAVPLDGESASTRVETRFRWGGPADWHVLLDLDWRQIGGVHGRLDKVVVAAALDPTRVFIPELVLELAGESLQAKALWTKGEKFQADLDGSILFTGLRDLLPPGAYPFVDSCQLTSGVRVTGKWEGSSPRPGDWKAVGKLSAADFLYKGVSVKGLEANWSSDGQTVEAKQVKLTRTEGVGTAEKVWIKPAEAMVEITGVNTLLQAQETARIFGGELERSCAPYRFARPPQIRVEGKVDVKSGERTDIRIWVQGGAMSYPFLGIDIPVEQIKSMVDLKGRNLYIRSLDAVLYGGKFGGSAYFDLSTPKTRFQTDFHGEEMEFSQAMLNLFKVSDVSGRCGGAAKLEGLVGDPRTLKGSGSFRVRDGYVLNIPFLGGLSDLMNAVLPSLGYAKAREARAEFTVADGKIRSENADIQSVTFTIIARGGYDFVSDQLDMDARVNIRGLFGLVLFPVSKLFEYHGTGPLRNAVWAPKLLED